MLDIKSGIRHYHKNYVDINDGEVFSVISIFSCQSLLSHYSKKRAITVNAYLSVSCIIQMTHIFFLHTIFIWPLYLDTYRTSAPLDCTIFHDIYPAKPKGSRKNKFVIFGYLIYSVRFIVCIFLWSCLSRLFFLIVRALSPWQRHYLVIYMGGFGFNLLK